MSFAEDVTLAATAIADAANAIQRVISCPSVLYRPTLFFDGQDWVAMLGPDRARGLCVTGNTPAQAMTRFDIAFHSARPGPGKL
jgi:hypothetical protein